MKYHEHFTKKFLGLNLTLFETALFSSLLLMCLMIVIDTMSGRNVGNYEQVKMAKLHAEQDLVASRDANN